jgi:long-chain acyl-CoA synthetase
MNIAHWLARHGLAAPDAPALAQGLEISARYGELAANTARRAGALRDVWGLNPGDRVAIIATNTPRYVKLLCAIWHAGLVAVPVNAKLHGLEIAFILAQSGARAAFVSDDLESIVAPHAPPSLERLTVIGGAEYRALALADPIRVEPRGVDDLAWLFYTSGTTGKPKGAMLTHGNLAAMSWAYLTEVDQALVGDAILHAAPMSHGSGLYIMAHVMRRGVNAVPESGGFDPAEIFALTQGWRARHGRPMAMFAAPTMVKRLVAAASRHGPGPGRGLRTLIYGGAPMYVADCKAALDALGPCLAQIYGLGESPMTITTLPKHEIADRAHPLWEARLASAGMPYPCVEVAVVDGEGQPLPVGDTGEVICKGTPVMAGYWDNPQATAKSLRDGWLFTGDVGAFDATGYLTLKDRSNDLIISGGSNIYPREVEEVLLTHEGVREVSVIGRPDAEWGESVIAYVVGEAGSQSLDALCLARIARFKRPKEYVFVEALPKNNYGKVLKTQLRADDARHVAERAAEGERG